MNSPIALFTFTQHMKSFLLHQMEIFLIRHEIVCYLYRGLMVYYIQEESGDLETGWVQFLKRLNCGELKFQDLGYWHSMLKLLINHNIIS